MITLLDPRQSEIGSRKPTRPPDGDGWRWRKETPNVSDALDELIGVQESGSNGVIDVWAYDDFLRGRRRYFGCIHQDQLIVEIVEGEKIEVLEWLEINRTRIV